MAKLRIVSHSDQRFQDRSEAGRLLARELAHLSGPATVVLGIPRGGVMVALEVGRALGAQVDIVFSRKLRAPGHLELAMGSVSENGQVFLNDMVVRELGITRDYIEQERALQMQEIARRAEAIRRVWPRVPLAGKTAIVTDDGVATGATTRAAIWSVRQQHPEKLVCAVPVGPEDTLRELAGEVDEMVCLRAPPYFVAVGQFYAAFLPVSDEDILAAFRRYVDSPVNP
ncbi:MAG: phosphoribosyltransferase [Chloroflexi bacterium]|nr:phosphoribosyltransferase [Chloroflexota bacterium]